MPYERDLIAERDKKSCFVGSVVKWWMVNYVTPEQLAEQEAAEKERIRKEIEEKEKAKKLEEEMDESLRLAMEITARLEAEAAEDEAIKQAEIEKAMAEAELGLNSSDYNPTTGSYSGGYGKNVTLDEEGLNQVDSILSEKSNNFDDLFAEFGE